VQNIGEVVVRAMVRASVAILFASFLWFVSSDPALAAVPRLSPPDAQAWQRDLDFLAAELPKRHKDLYSRVDRAKFAAEVADLRARMPSLTRDEAIAGIARIVASAKDAHTAIQSLLYQSPAAFHYIPASLYLFKDGLYVYAADRPYAAAVGARVLRIGNASTEQALAAVAPLIPADNKMAVKERAPLYLEAPEILHALHLLDDPARVTLVLRKNGRTFPMTFTPLPAPRPSDDNWALGQRFSKMPAWVDARSPGPPPLWLRDPQAYFWHTYLPDSGTLYAQFNDVANKDKESVSDWVGKMQAVLDANDVRRFILDLRWNTGGNNYLNKPLLLMLIKSKMNRPGGLFVIIGRRNFSAAQNLINDIGNYTDAIFVGEPTASPANFFGDATSIVLPNSKLRVSASTLWWQDADPRDRRIWTAPDLAAELSFDDYQNNRDPALDIILAYKPETPLADLMHDAFARGDTAGAIQAYRRFRVDPLHAYTDTERAMNSLGYRLLGEKMTSQAIAVFKANVEAYPGSPNVYDSLADAYIAAGDKQAAIESYRRMLEVDPQNAIALNAIRRLETQN
jgi:tetratricopeptide (TPR) repeat protein